MEEARDGGVHVPWADYVVTLDADSLLLADYARRLVHFMEQPENGRVAVFQTPYSSFPRAPGTRERIAGATTDMPYIVHQGFTGHNATYWVGADALLRRSALEDIAESDTKRGFVVRRCIQDRTVIEDTESTIDLVAEGWRLHNYPERLAYSATPPDFGSLLIQRRRWANGGLLVLRKLFRHLAGRTKGRPTFGEGFMRLRYLVSTAAVNLGLLILLAFPIPRDIQSPWLPLSALPCFLLYGRDLVHLGYRAGDLLRVYALNLLLIPVNLAGVFNPSDRRSRNQDPLRAHPQGAGAYRRASDVHRPGIYAGDALAHRGDRRCGSAALAARGVRAHECRSAELRRRAPCRPQGKPRGPPRADEAEAVETAGGGCGAR